MIGTKHETSLHRELKFSYTGLDGQTEASVGSFVADGINALGEYIEIQTGNFGQLKKKAKHFSAHGKLRIIYPVIITKYIEVYDIHGKKLYSRKSPRKGNAWDIFRELIYAPELALNPNIVIELALVDAAEHRIKDGKGSWRRKGISIQDRKLLVLHERICLNKPSDYLRFIPFKKNEEFTTNLLSKNGNITTDLARKTVYVLARIGVIKKTGMKGNFHVYKNVSFEKQRQKRKKTDFLS